MIKFFTLNQQDKEPTFAITAPPRVGARWFCAAAQSVGFQEWNKVQIELPPVSIAVVRHPFEWLRSAYYSDDKLSDSTANPHLNLLVKLIREQTDFVTLVELLANRKSTITKMFDFYRGMSVNRLEDFPWAPLEFFQSIKEVNLEQVATVKSLQPTNQNQQKSRFTKPTEDRLRKIVVKAEQEFCKRYNYF